MIFYSFFRRQIRKCHIGRFLRRNNFSYGIGALRFRSVSSSLCLGFLKNYSISDVVAPLIFQERFGQILSKVPTDASRMHEATPASIVQMCGNFSWRCEETSGNAGRWCEGASGNPVGPWQLPPVWPTARLGACFVPSITW